MRAYNTMVGTCTAWEEAGPGKQSALWDLDVRFLTSFKLPSLLSYSAAHIDSDNEDQIKWFF